MKRVILCLLGLCLLLSGCGKADGAKIKFSPGSQYEICTDGKNTEKVANIIGVSEDELAKYMSDNSVITLAVNSDNTSQIKLFVYKNEFSESAVDISALDDEGLSSLAKKVAGENADFGICHSKGRKYIKISEALRDSGGEYTSIQFLTVFEGRIYQLSIYDAGKDAERTAERLLEKLNINQVSGGVLSIAVAVAMACFAITIVVCIIGIVKDKLYERTIKAREEE